MNTTNYGGAYKIMSFVLEGDIRHFDTRLNDWKPLSAGDAQIIRAGSGISHAEHIHRGGVIFQIWLDPGLDTTLQQPASYDDYKAHAFPVTRIDGGQIIHYAGTAGIMRLDTPEADIRRIQLSDASTLWAGDDKVIRSLYIIRGSGTVGDKTVEQDDFVIIDDGADLTITPHPAGLDIFALSIPSVPGYPTYVQRMMR